MATARATVRQRSTPGRPTKYQLEGLFLPSIAWEMKSEGFPWHELENEPNELGTLFRNMRRQDVDPRDSLRSILSMVQEALPSSTAAQFQAAAQAVKDGKFTDDLLAQLPGNWACFRMGTPDMKSPYFSEYVLVEAESKPADAALHEGNYRHAAELLQNNERLRRYWNEETIKGLASATTPAETLRPRLRAWLQLQVDVLAKWSTQDPVALQTQRDCGSLENLLTGLRDDAQVAPGAMWLRAMTRLTKAHSLAEMLALVRKETDPSTLPSEATIKRWSRGSQFPVPSQKLEKFVQRVSRRAAIADQNLSYAGVFESARWYYWAAKRFHSVLWFATMFHSGTGSPEREDGVHASIAWLRAEFKRLQKWHAQ